MKKFKMYLSSIKSRYFMLLSCLTLLLGTISCSNDNFENDLSEEPKQLSKAELIEQALSRMPQTRADASYPVVMVTTKETFSIRCFATESVTVHWDDVETTVIPAGDYTEYTHTYSDDEPVNLIYLETSNEAIEYLDVYLDQLLSLNVTNNINLSRLSCGHNRLDVLDLTGCPNLELLFAGGNNLTSIDLTHLPHLNTLSLPLTQLTEIDISKNPELESLSIGYNQITNLDLTKNTALKSIVIPKLPLEKINNLSINSRSFAVFPQLEHLEVSYTPFVSLDFSDNPLLNQISIEGTAITQLDISNLRIEILDAENSQLTNLKYTSSNLVPTCFYVNILNTPFEKVSSNIYSLITTLPNRTNANEYGFVIEGQLYVTPSLIPNTMLGYLAKINWLVNPSDTRSLYSELSLRTGMDEHERFISILAGKN